MQSPNHPPTPLFSLRAHWQDVFQTDSVTTSVIMKILREEWNSGLLGQSGLFNKTMKKAVAHISWNISHLEEQNIFLNAGLWNIWSPWA